MGLAEYQLRMEAYQLRQVQKHEEIAMQAWMNQAVQATKGTRHPRPLFKTFKEFFDTQEQVNRVRTMYEPGFEARPKQADAASIFAKRLKEFQQLKSAGKIVPWSERERR